MIELECPHCGLHFPVPSSMKGGQANCKDCGRLVEVPGTDGIDQLFWIGVCGGAVGVVALSAFLIVQGAWAAGLTILAFGALVGGIGYAVS